MTKLSEGTKITLTIGQLKRLVKEAKIKDRNNNTITVDDSQLTIILKGTEESRNVNRSGFCRRMWVFHSLDSAVKFCDKTHIGCDGIETIIVHNKGKTEERGPFFDGEVMGTTNDWDKVKKIIETLVGKIKED